jgi:hypothetical protein
MKKWPLRTILLSTIGVFFLFVTVLAIHIYFVTRPKAPGATTRVMARIDLKQPIDLQDADKITTWLYQQNGVDHVMVNSKTEIVVFTFFPVKADVNKILKEFSSSLHYTNAKRYIPTEEELKSGCPVASTSFSYKIYNSLKNLF